MALNNFIHDCSTCKYHKKSIENVVIDKDDVENFRKISSKLDGLNRLIDEGVKDKEADAENQKIFFEEALKHQALLLDESSNWWNMARRKYHIDDSAVTNVDPNTNTFTRCYDDNDRVYVSAQYVPKD